MAISETNSPWWSEIFQTEFHQPQKRYRSNCISPPLFSRIGHRRVTSVRRITKAFLVRAGGFFAPQPPPASSFPCVDPLEAYMHACIAATFFCYVSPALYGLTDTADEQGASRRNHSSGEDS